jgi:hypothetical protein
MAGHAHAEGKLTGRPVAAAGTIWTLKQVLKQSLLPPKSITLQQSLLRAALSSVTLMMLCTQVSRDTVTAAAQLLHTLGP